MYCLRMSNDGSLIYVVDSCVSHCSFSAFWRPENAFSAPSSTGFIKTMIFDIIVMGLEISVNRF